MGSPTWRSYVRISSPKTFQSLEEWEKSLPDSTNTFFESAASEFSDFYPQNWFAAAFGQDILNQSSGKTTAGEIPTELAGEENDIILSINPSKTLALQFLGQDSLGSSAFTDLTQGTTVSVSATTWSDTIRINRVAKTERIGDTVFALQIDANTDKRVGSVLQGSDGNDILRGRAGWDFFDGESGNDLIRGGNGRDIITGGLGADELWGDFGWNTFTSEEDGSADLLVIKSDQYLDNWFYGTSGNNPNGEKCDIIEGLDAIDRINIQGVATEELAVRDNITAKGVTGIGIYARGALEALYIGGDLTVSQITAMTSGDASEAAINNQIFSYGWTQNPGTLVPQVLPI